MATAIGTALLLAGLLAPGAEARTEAFQALAPSPAPLTSVTTVPTTGLIYAQENNGTKFFVYDPRTNGWTELAPAPINSGNNGGATYLNGKIYTAYTENGSELGVYDIASNSWTTIPNPIAKGTGDITAGNGVLYLAIDQDFVAYDPATGVTTPLAEAPLMQTSCNEGFEEWGGLQFTGTKIYGHQGDGCQGFAVYDIAGNTWTELPLTPNVIEEGKEVEEGPVLGSSFNPVTDTYLTYGPYGGKTLFRWDIEGGGWSTGAMPFEMDDAGSAYVSIPGYEGVYIVQGEGGVEFTRYTEQNTTDLSTSMTAKAAVSATGGEITYSIEVKNNGPERAGGVVLSDTLPSGTKLVSAQTARGTCAGSTAVSCELGGLASGASVGLTIKVTAGFGTVSNTASVSSRALDTNPANDSAGAVVNLVAPVSNPKCVVPSVRGLTLAKAKVALQTAGCKPGKLFRHHGNKIAKGGIIRGGNGVGKNIAPGSKVNLIVSLGKKVHSKGAGSN